MGPHHLHLPIPHLHGHAHHHHSPSPIVPKGCVAIRVGPEGGEEEPRRFVVPVEYLNHPLFSNLLKVAEDEYGFKQKGTIMLPCGVAEFQSVQSLINQDIRHQFHHRHSYRSNSGGAIGLSAQHHLRIPAGAPRLY